MVCTLDSLAVDIVLCSWARHFTLTVPLSAQEYKWAPANLMLQTTVADVGEGPVGSESAPSQFAPTKS